MSAESEAVIGLEVHVQLATRSKLFCPCPTASFGTVANTHICPVCTGQPGVLPVLNRRAVDLALRGALALNCNIRPVSVFARKNYFYPDLPKNYQISQYEEPFSERGYLDSGLKRIGIQRIHLEEDAGKLLHEVGSDALDHSLVDFNRSGIALIEIVSDPEISNPEEAYRYLTALKSILRYLDVSRCDMEKGEMRCDANLSLRPKGSKALGTKTEIKNLNSFKAVREALEYEALRQGDLLKKGERIAQETRLWDAKESRTEPMRSKEEAHDYRYFPEPDLLPLSIDDEWLSEVRKGIPELPAARKKRLMTQCGLLEHDAEVLISDKALADYFEEGIRDKSVAPKVMANWVTNNLLGKLNEENLDISNSRVSASFLGRLAYLVSQEGESAISTATAKQVFEKMWETGKDPDSIVQELGGAQVSDTQTIQEWAKAALSENPRAAEDFKKGNERALGVLVGHVMKKSKGKANPGVVNQVLKELLR